MIGTVAKRAPRDFLLEREHASAGRADERGGKHVARVHQPDQTAHVAVGGDRDCVDELLDVANDPGDAAARRSGQRGNTVQDAGRPHRGRRVGVEQNAIDRNRRVVLDGFAHHAFDRRRGVLVHLASPTTDHRDLFRDQRLRGECALPDGDRQAFTDEAAGDGRRPRPHRDHDLSGTAEVERQAARGKPRQDRFRHQQRKQLLVSRLDQLGGPPGHRGHRWRRRGAQDDLAGFLGRRHRRRRFSSARLPSRRPTPSRGWRRCQRARADRAARSPFCDHWEG